MLFSGSPFTIAWRKDDHALVSSQKYEFVEFEDGTQILTVHEPTSEDNGREKIFFTRKFILGIYTCTAESEHGLATNSTEVVLKRERKDSLDIEVVQMPTVEISSHTQAVNVLTKDSQEAPPTDEVIGVTEIRKNEGRY